MAIAINKNTRQNPMAEAGRTGTQVIKFIPAPRVYIKATESQTAAPVQTHFTVSDGTTPSGWTDLGIVAGMAKITYDKKIREIRTGLDDILRQTYVESRTAKLEFSLQQFDDVVIEQMTGYTGSVIQSGSIVNYQIGQEDVIQKAIMLVAQNKLDKKEFQFYNPNALMSFSFEEENDGLVLKVMADLPAYTAQGESQESFLSTTIFKL
jgi:hypothetical protein